MIKLLNQDNMMFESNQKFNLIYADMIYEDNINLYWIEKFWSFLAPDSVFVVQTDWHSVFEVGCYLKNEIGAIHLNHICWKNEFGNFPKNKFRQSHDDILIFSNSKNYKFYPDRVQVEKATAKSRGLNKSGRLTKLATSVWTDICLTTVAKERVKNGDHNIRWQKPVALADRICSPFTDEDDYILDIYMGSGTFGEWSKLNNRNYIGIESDKNVFNIAKKRISEKQ
jgi:DNA modification methylase